MNVLAGHFSQHLVELRRRVLLSLLAIVISSGVAYLFSEQLVRFFMAPLFRAHPALARLVYTNLTEAFISYLKVSVLVGLIGSFPVVCYQIWRFISPGLYSHERRQALKVVFWATLLFASGIGFAFWVALPDALAFLMGFASEGLQPYPRLDAYLTFVARGCLAFGLAFEVPFLMVVATKTGLVVPGYFRQKRKYAYPLILVVAFLLTGGDPFAAFLLALPLLALYEAGILTIRLFLFPARRAMGK